MKSRLPFTNPMLALHKLIFLILSACSCTSYRSSICRFLRLCRQLCPTIRHSQSEYRCIQHD